MRTTTQLTVRNVEDAAALIPADAGWNKDLQAFERLNYDLIKPVGCPHKVIALRLHIVLRHTPSHIA